MAEQNKIDIFKLKEELIKKAVQDAFLEYALAKFLEKGNEETNICKGENEMSDFTCAARSLESMTKVDRHMDLCMKLNDLYARKNRDYGDSFHETFVEEGLAMTRIRLADKFQRFKTLSKKADMAGEVPDESIIDTLMDLANYSLMTVLELQLKNEELERQKKDQEMEDLAQTSASCADGGGGSCPPYKITKYWRAE